MRILRLLLVILIMTGCTQSVNVPNKDTLVSNPNVKLIVSVYDSGFEETHDSFNGVSSASDGKIYYVLPSNLIDTAGQMYSFDPKTTKIEHLGDLTDICGEKDMKVVAQGKVHTNFIESQGKLYFSTHRGYYNMADGVETVGDLKNGFSEYRGGHFLAFDMKNKTFEDLAIAPYKEGIITMNMDTLRGLIYGLTWPTGYLLRYDISKKEMKDLGPYDFKGEAGEIGADYRTVCRSIVIDPGDGTVYLSTAEGEIKKLRVDSDVIETVEGESMRKDYFGTYDVSLPTNTAYHWRQAFWVASERKIYGIHGKSGYLFSFDPAAPRIEVLERLTSIPSRLTGMNDQYRYGYLGFKLGPDGHTIYYLTGAPIYINDKKVLPTVSTELEPGKTFEDLHLITYNIQNGKYLDHGAIYYPDGQRASHVNSIAIGLDGTVYCISRVTKGEKTRVDLISIPDVFKK